ncbi:MAG: Ca-activated chloride channel [Actinomycetota bacterium]|jgi:Ca-activated chloride channel family protein|nr:Ca-activated chloride channel [Actinomycetota bacterium]
MTFTAPGRLWFLALVAAFAVAYGVNQWRRSREANRFAEAHLLPLVAPDRPGPWRHLLAAVVALGLVAGTLAAARPARLERTPRQTATVVLAIDLSDSMTATDVSPSRLAAAKAAATQFIKDLPAGFELGLVSGGADARLIVEPTVDHQKVTDALGGLTTAPGTALGDAITTALSSIRSAQKAAGTNGSTSRAARIVLLSDGVSTTGRSNDEAAAAAVDAGVPVWTIAFGTANASVQSQGQTVSVPVDKTALREIAKATDGTFFEAATRAQLRSVYDKIGTDVTFVVQEKDLSDWFVGLALLLLFFVVATSMVTTARPVQV